MRSGVDRRLKRVAFSSGLNPGKFDLIAFLRKLPDDAKLIAVGEDLGAGCSYLLFHSSEWDIVYEGYQLPYFEPWVTTIETVEAREPTPKETNLGVEPIKYPNYETLMALCECDLKYTGQTHHRPACPLR